MNEANVDCELCNSVELEELKTARSSNRSSDPDSLVDLFWDPLSQPSRSVKLFLLLCAIPHTDHIIHIKYGEQLESEFKKVNSLGKVPAIRCGTFVLSESAAIYDYLSYKFPHLCPDWLYPKDLERRARMNEYLHWHHNNLRLNAAMLFQESFVKPRFTGQHPNPERVARFEKGLKKAVKDLSGHFLKDTIFITSEQRPSIADIHGACELMQLKTFDFNLTKLSHKMDFWLQKTRDFVNPHFDEVHEELMSLSKHQHKL
ncbi:uncharacterized protein LOC142348494 [Convolutriloba macropyga]|uniref:uncharacterized protein LOC142348494 n=1 Tax=Convolutriloba macropyga TaxID=536237 RepID=UPI003F523C0A